MVIIRVEELPSFTKKVGKVISTKLSIEIAEYLALNPKSGDIIPGLYGLRKARFKIEGKGKQGGVRVIYYFHNEQFPLLLFNVYKKMLNQI